MSVSPPAHWFLYAKVNCERWMLPQEKKMVSTPFLISTLNHSLSYSYPLTHTHPSHSKKAPCLPALLAHHQSKINIILSLPIASLPNRQHTQGHPGKQTAGVEEHENRTFCTLIEKLLMLMLFFLSLLLYTQHIPSFLVEPRPWRPQLIA